MRKSELIKNSLDKKHDQFLEEYRNLFYLLIGLIIAYITSSIYNFPQEIQGIFFSGLILVAYAIYLIRERLEKVRKDITKIKLR